ncbi:NAD(P)(+) transhydrogenase (Re/Si-specific) subunit beta [Acidobacteriota bacterium]
MDEITNLAYLLSAVFFIFGLKRLSSPKTARQGNFFAMLGMFIAFVVTLLDKGIVSYTFIIVGILVGIIIGAFLARVVQMTSMPQMVAAFNGLGGGASTLVAMAEFFRAKDAFAPDASITMVLSLFIGTLTFSGSFIAFGKLQYLIKSAPVSFPLQQPVNVLLLLGAIGLGAYFVYQPVTTVPLYIIAGLAGLLGITLTLAIGGADMPVVVSLLNSYSGIAASMTGFVLSNNILIISGALVGASGLILTSIMCKAMNRSLTNVLFGKVGVDEDAEAEGEEHRNVTAYTAEDAATMLENAGSVIIVPGYGLAVAQAQHVLQEMANILINNGVKVRYAIHPVAGRMPGHMNVLLAEANVPYDLLFEMDAINEDFKETDVALVIGANDVVNPAARDRKGSPLYGMPILNVDHAKSIIISKRSMRPGFAGEGNELFYDPKTMMVFGDAKDSVSQISSILKQST